MKKRMTVLLTFICVLMNAVGIVPVFAESVYDDWLYYELTDEEIKIIDISDENLKSKDLSLPSSIDGYPVTSIGTNAFSGAQITSVIIPDSVVSIGSSAFYNCTSLNSITIPVSVKNILRNAFYGVTNLSTVYYLGTLEDWRDITISTRNTNLTSANIIYVGEQYTYTFQDDDETVLKQRKVPMGTKIIPPANPLKEDDSLYTYKFAGWSGFTTGMTVSKDVIFTANYKAISLNSDIPSVDESETNFDDYEDLTAIQTFNFDGTDNSSKIIGLKSGVSQVNTSASQLEIARDWEEEPLYLKMDEKIDLTSDYSYVFEFKVKTPTVNSNSRMIALTNGTNYYGVYDAMSSNLILANNGAGSSDNEKTLQIAHTSKGIGSATCDEWKVIRYTLSKYSYRMEIVVYNADGSIKSQEESRGPLNSISGANKVGYHVLGKSYDYIALGHINVENTDEKLVIDYVKVSKMSAVDQSTSIEVDSERPLESGDPDNPKSLLNVNFDDKSGNFVDFSSTSVDKTVMQHNDGSKYLQIDYYSGGDTFGGWYFNDTLPSGDKSDYIVSFDFMIHRGKHDNSAQFAESYIAINDSLQSDGEQAYHQFRLLGAVNYGSTAKFRVATTEITGDNSDIIEDSWYSYYMKFNRGTGAYTVEITHKGTGNVLKYSGQTSGELWGGMIGSKEYDSLKYYRNGSISLDNIKVEVFEPKIPTIANSRIESFEGTEKVVVDKNEYNIFIDKIVFDCNVKMDSSTITGETLKFTVNGVDNPFKYEVDCQKIIITDFVLTPLTEYQICFSNNIKSKYGDNLHTEYTYSFTTGPDPTVDPVIEASVNSVDNSILVTPFNIAKGKNVLVALYSENQLIDVKSQTYELKELLFTLDDTYDYAKVMIWKNLSTLEPVCESVFAE